MKLSRNHLMFGLIAVLLILSAFTLAGNPILPPDALAGNLSFSAVVAAFERTTGATMAEGPDAE